MKRLPFGITSATAIFQKTVSNLLQNIEGVIVYLDDILIHSSSMEKHLEILKATLKKLHESGFKLNESKCLLGQTSITFLGFHFSKGKMTPIPEKLKAIAELQPPRNKKELQSLLGSLNYYINFVPHQASILKPL